jgi:hypothetical protein
MRDEGEANNFFFARKLTTAAEMELCLLPAITFPSWRSFQFFEDVAKQFRRR